MAGRRKSAAAEAMDLMDSIHEDAETSQSMERFHQEPERDFEAEAELYALKANEAESDPGTVFFDGVSRFLKAVHPFSYADDFEEEWTARQAEKDRQRRPVVSPKPQSPQGSGGKQVEMFKSRSDYPQVSIDCRIESFQTKPGKDGETIGRILLIHDTREPEKVLGPLMRLQQVFCTVQIGGSCVGVKDLD